ncbi:MAG: MerR family transcriptional regulator [Actinomycetota bacterium]|nr:MerR family transcriptional regulator [Actinomycetota bacterium]
MHGDGPADAVPAWTAGAVARHLGVAPSTLRTWSRRYGLDPARHDSGRHRRYQASDIVRLDVMRRLVAQGVAPAAAARWVHTQPLDTLDSAPGPADRVEAPVPARVVRGLVTAALRLDGDAMAAALARHLNELGVISTWDQVCRPVIAEIESRVTEQGRCIDVEHLLSWTISCALHRVPVAAQTPGAGVVLLACAEEERHTLALDALRAALASRGIAVRMLGADTPTAALAHAARRCRPAAVVLWAQTARTAALSQLATLRQSSAETVLIAAGPGWTERRLPEGIIESDSLQSAVLLTLGAAAPAPLPDGAPDASGHLPSAAEERR